MGILCAFGLLLVIAQCNGSLSSFEEASPEKEEDRVNLHPGRVILYRPIKTNQPPGYQRDYYRDYEEERRRFPTNAQHDYGYRPKPHDYNDYKLPASKYTNDYFQPPRPTPQTVTGNYRSQTRAGFTFPDVHITSQDHFYWSPRGAGQQNTNDYNQIPRGRYQSRPAVITYDNGDLRGKQRPALVQQDTGLPIQDSDIVVSSGPGGIKHIVHDLRKPSRQLINDDNTDNAATLKTPERGFKTGFVVHRFSTVPNEHGGLNYKGVPVFLEGGTFRGKEYDPRFVTLYRQVLEENQKKLIPRFRLKKKQFNPSPTIGWFSEPDPIFHSQNLLTITANPEITTFTAVPASSEFPGQFPDSINSQLPPPTGNESTDIPYVSPVATTIPPHSSTTESRTIQADESSAIKPDKLSMLTAEPSQQSATQISLGKNVLNGIASRQEDSSTETSEAETTLKASKPDNDNPPTATLKKSAADSATTSDASTGTDIISTSISKSVTSTREQKPSETPATTLGEPVPTNQSPIEPSAKTTYVRNLQATEATTTEVIDVSTSVGDFNTFATSDAVEAIITTVEPASDIANYRQSATLVEARTQAPTTLVTEVALTTLNFLVMSLVNQARANSIIDNDVSTISSMEYSTITT